MAPSKLHCSQRAPPTISPIYRQTRRQTHRHTDGRDNTHFASAMPHAKCD